MRILRNTPEFKPVEVEVAEELIDGYLEDPVESGYYILIAESDSVLSGYICYGPTPMTEGTWDIYWMAVEHTSQGQGIGGRLLEAAEIIITKAGGYLSIIETSSIPSYEKTVRFYLGQGYGIVANIPDFYAPGDGKIMLTKKLVQGVSKE
jgi:GNAT superfamily N-acetyltransferase